jgi:hypothetical protein
VNKLATIGFGNKSVSLKSAADPEGGAPARAPPKFENNMICLRKIVIFHTKYHTNFRASLRNWKKYDFFA